ncbi:extracellular solute-binding protein [Pelomonas sp. SE-A7]|uniref:extracellular solute-binding protein n=1 Tax=Pelomonas sp. SE-A7 TaxID=3054953 RepID=UPI00259CD0B3|nr:extracellular solute-binding protein [Pelomonas sp. SE-A7]MDM4766505.1 extracellular solute-binding protein [Pelomonas sp. SE-A7]
MDGCRLPLSAVSRRALCALLLAGLPAGAAWAAGQTLRVLAWPGYAEPEVVQAFEKKTGAKVELTVIDTDEALWHKLSQRAGPAFDVFAVNTAELQRYRAAGLVQPVDPALVPNARQQLPRFRDRAAIPGLVAGHGAEAKVLAIPFTYAEMGLIYDRHQFSQPPDSLQALWDPRWQGKVIAYNGGSHNFSLAAQMLGAESPFRLPPALRPKAVDKLIELRRNVLGFYSEPNESVKLFQRHGAALMYANYGRQQYQLLKAAGADVGYAIPREGALAWLDCWAIPAASRQRALAHAWIDHLLGRQASSLLVSRQGLAATTAESAASAGAHRLLWLEPVEDAGQRELMWSRIRSGDRAARVLAP